MLACVTIGDRVVAAWLKTDMAPSFVWYKQDVLTIWFTSTF